MSLERIIIQKIQKEGPVAFCDFMEMALYYPQFGYYDSEKQKIGKRGDFYTSSNVSYAFGAMIAKQIIEMYEVLGGQEFVLVEYGAGEGTLCFDVLNYISENAQKVMPNLRYVIIEKSESLRNLQKLKLGERVEWIQDICELKGFNGCVLSNEVADNFAVHRVEMHDRLMEVFVDWKNGFKEILLPARSSLVNYLDALKVQLPQGFKTEINLEADRWIVNIAESLKRGFVLTIDYGFPSGELYDNYRRNGTLLCYKDHAVHANPYMNIGLQDITSHINFSALALAGSNVGLELSFYRRQSEFLLAMGIRKFLAEAFQKDILPERLKKESRILNLLVQEMGPKFGVLVQSKGIEKSNLMGGI